MQRVGEIQTRLVSAQRLLGEHRVERIDVLQCQQIPKTRRDERRVEPVDGAQHPFALHQHRRATVQASDATCFSAARACFASSPTIKRKTTLVSSAAISVGAFGGLGLGGGGTQHRFAQHGRVHLGQTDHRAAVADAAADDRQAAGKRHLAFGAAGRSSTPSGVSSTSSCVPGPQRRAARSAFGMMT